MSKILQTINEQSQSSWSDDWEFVSYYNWTGTAGSLSPPVPNSGNGEPKLANGLVACSHRPSDDLCVFSTWDPSTPSPQSGRTLALPKTNASPDFITSDNAMLSVELNHIADVLDASRKLSQVSRQARQYARTIRNAVLHHTKTPNGIFAYETNGYGGQYIMDDANVPSLVSLPYLGFLPRSDSTYRKTKDAMFSRSNPYYAVGKKFQGIG